jgi:hypothetical protein
MKALLLTLLITTPAMAVDYYADIGIGFNNAEWDKPEVKLVSPLARFSIGAQYKNGYSISLEHVSSIEVLEDGYGMNALWINKRIKFQ